MMAPEMEKPRVTEIRVRMDCNGCVQKIKKALNGVAGISDTYIDFPQQKITIVGWADPQKIVKAIKKTRKTAVICLHTEQQPPSSDQPPEGSAPQPDPTSQPPTEPLQNNEPAPPPSPEPPKEHPPLENTPPPPPHPEPEQSPKPENTNATPSQSGQPPSQPKDHEEIHVIHHHHQPEYGYQYGYGPNFQQGYYGHWNPHRGGPQFREGPSHLQPNQSQPVCVTHSYNTYKPSPYVTEYAYPSSPSYSRYGVPDEYPRYSVPDEYAYYRAPENYTRAYYGDGNNGNGNVTSMFSEENPNACTIA